MRACTVWSLYVLVQRELRGRPQVGLQRNLSPTQWLVSLWFLLTLTRILQKKTDFGGDLIRVPAGPFELLVNFQLRPSCPASLAVEVKSSLDSPDPGPHIKASRIQNQAPNPNNNHASAPCNLCVLLRTFCFHWGWVSSCTFWIRVSAGHC